MKGYIPEALPENEINKLFEEYQNGSEKAREKLINHNIRLVSYIVNKYFKTVPFDYDDIESIGLSGLIKAVDSFDVDKNIKFGTFATRVIYNEIAMFLRKEKGKNDVSLEDTIYANKDGDEITLGDTISDEKANFVENIDNAETLEMIRNYVLSMKESKEKQCIMLYFGFNCKSHKQREIAAILGLSQSYVTRILGKTVKKIGEELKEIGVINRVGKIQSDEVISLNEIPSDKYNVGQIFKDNKNFNIIKELVANMPNSLAKQAIIMHYGFGDKSYDKKSIAKFLGISRNTLSSIMKKIENEINETLRNMDIRDSEGNYINLSYFGDLIYSERKKISRMNRLRSIYELLKTNDKELVKQVIANLSEEEKNLFERRNGKNLDHPVVSDDWTKEDGKKYKQILIPKMRSYLSQLNRNGFIMSKQALPKQVAIINENEKLAMEQLIEPINDKNNIKDGEGNDNMYEIDDLIKDNDGFKKAKEFILAEPDFTDKQALIMYLGLNGKSYSQKEIAERFGCSVSNISHITRQLSTKIDEKLRRNNIKYTNGVYITVSMFKKFLNKQKNKTDYQKRNLVTIYEQLHLSDRSLINNIINKLNEEEKRLFNRRNGNNLDTPILSSDWTAEDDEKYNTLIPKMEKILIEIQNIALVKKQEILEEGENSDYLTVDLLKEEKHGSETFPLDKCMGGGGYISA